MNITKTPFKDVYCYYAFIDPNGYEFVTTDHKEMLPNDYRFLGAPGTPAWIEWVNSVRLAMSEKRVSISKYKICKIEITTTAVELTLKGEPLV